MPIESSEAENLDPSALLGRVQHGSESHSRHPSWLEGRLKGLMTGKAVSEEEFEEAEEDSDDYQSVACQSPGGQGRSKQGRHRTSRKAESSEELDFQSLLQAQMAAGGDPSSLVPLMMCQMMMEKRKPKPHRNRSRHRKKSSSSSSSGGSSSDAVDIGGSDKGMKSVRALEADHQIESSNEKPSRSYRSGARSSMDSQGLHQALPLGQVQGAVSVRYRGRSRLRDVAAEGIREHHGSVHSEHEIEDASRTPTRRVVQRLAPDGAKRSAAAPRICGNQGGASCGLRLPQQLEQVEAESQGDRGIGWRGARREEVRHSLLGEDNAGLNSFDPRSCLS